MRLELLESLGSNRVDCYSCALLVPITKMTLIASHCDVFRFDHHCIMINYCIDSVHTKMRSIYVTFCSAITNSILYRTHPSLSVNPKTIQHILIMCEIVHCPFQTFSILINDWNCYFSCPFPTSFVLSLVFSLTRWVCIRYSNRICA